MFNVPVVIIVFNRPDTTRKLLSTLKIIEPAKLFVIADAAREGVADESEKVKATRNLIEDIDWPCEISKNYADKNMGCMNRVSTGLDWVFGQVDRAIILEDDCVPVEDYFLFCEELLEMYSDDERIMSISGTRLSPEIDCQGTSYTFSRYGICWGWATWSRAWQLYDSELRAYKPIMKSGYLSFYLGGLRPSLYWQYILGRVYKGKINSWAYRWMFSHWVNDGKSIVPSKNLVTNIGVGNDATHTKDNNKFLGRKAYNLDKPLVHPENFIQDYKMDAWIENNFYSKSIVVRIKWLLNKLFKFNV